MYGRRLTCPHCGRKIGFFNRIEKCAFSGELVCRKCIVSGRFSDTVADKIPSEFREKFRFFNAFLFFVWVFIALVILQRAWYTWSGWTFYNLNLLTHGVEGVLEMWILGIILLILSLRLPHLGTWMFYWWIGRPKNRKKVEEAVREMEIGEYRSTNKIYKTKTKFFEYLKKSKTKIVFWPAIICNILFIPVFFVMKNKISLSGTYFSLFAGILYVATLVLNFLVIIIAAGFYSHKNPGNHAQKRRIEFLSWFYVILFPIAFFSFIIGEVALIHASSALGLPNKPRMYNVFVWALMIQTIVAIILSLYLLYKGKPNYELQQERKQKVGAEAEAGYSVKYYFYQIPKSIITLVFFGILLFCLGVCLLVLFIDPTLVIGILASTYLLMGVFIPVIFVVLKLVKRRPKKYSQFFWTSAKIATIVFCIAVTPAVMTNVWTNNSVQAQFNTQFGPNWENQIPANLSSKMRDVPYSAFENFFGFNIPSVNAKYNIIYDQDSPRYVKWSNGTVIDNGTTKYTERVDNFTMDAYLPSNLQFGDGNSEKLPVIIFCHGIGMSKGTGNANFSITKYFANQGYLVLDMMYGYCGWETLNPNQGVDTGGKIRGYDFPDTIQHVANVTYFLAADQNYYHADMNNIYFAGRSFGGWMAADLAYLYNTSFFGANFTQDMTVRGCISFYGAQALLDVGSTLYANPLLNGLVDTTAPYVRGSSNPTEPNYNPEWNWYDPYYLVNASETGNHVCPTLFIHGTQDPLVPPGWDRRLQTELRSNGDKAITAFYPLGSHGCDALHWSQYGQSVIYYMERFLALTRSY